jgi:uncharacterized protein (TIGR03790 family)
LVKNNDELSLRTALLYKQERNIPEAHIFYLDLPNKANISPKQFKALYQTLKTQAGDDIQAFVATWKAPYRVGCMSITSALTFGYDQKWCQPKKKGCFPTPNSPYFNAKINLPWQDLGIRPTMLLTGKDYEAIYALVQNGVESDGTYPKGNAYLVKTRDRARSTRFPIFKQFAQHYPNQSHLKMHFIDTKSQNIDDSLSFKENVMIYQTGLKQVANLETIQFLPGAVADHLTSFGGNGLGEGGQMKAFRWLEAGATGSYGTVVEPCNFVQKFPNPAILIPSYLQGETLIESYWKSVQQPSEGLFIGEPLAKPYDLFKVSMTNNTLTIVTNRLKSSGSYRVQEWDRKKRIFKAIKAKISYNKHTNIIIIQIEKPSSQKYKIIDINSRP